MELNSANSDVALNSALDSATFNKIDKAISSMSFASDVYLDVDSNVDVKLDSGAASVNKDNHTIRIRHPLPHFLTIAMETVEKWSHEYEIGLRKFATKPTISLKLWTESYNWARSDIPLKIVHQDEVTITVEVEAQVVRAKKAKNAIVVPEALSSEEAVVPPQATSASLSKKPNVAQKASSSQCEDAQNFEKYKLSFLKWTTKIMKKQNCLYHGLCNCPAFAKEYICKHVIGLAIRLKYVLPPAEAKTVPIGQKRKRGRPTKTKPALMVQ